MPKCSFCGEQYEPPRGLSFVKNDGTVVYLCSAKCRKNMQMKKRKVRWITEASKVKSSTKTKKTKKKKVNKNKAKKK
jgi:large subunit ribosomal protein L24e